MKTRSPLVLGTSATALPRLRTAALLQKIQELHPRLECVQAVAPAPATTPGRPGVPFLAEPPAVTADLDARLLAGEFRLVRRYATDLRPPLAGGLARAAVLERGTPFDAFLNRDGRITDEMPDGSLVGVLNLRARAQMQALWPGLEVRVLPGGVEQAVEAMMRRRLVDGLVLPALIAEHLGIQALVTEIYFPEMMLPGGGQGVELLLARADDEEAIAVAHALHSPASALELEAEAAFMERVASDQDVPAGVLARVEGKRVEVSGAVASPSGASVNRATREGPATQAGAVGAALAEQLLLDASTLLSLLEADFPEGLPAGELDDDVARRLDEEGFADAELGDGSGPGLDEDDDYLEAEDEEEEESDEDDRPRRG